MPENSADRAHPSAVLERLTSKRPSHPTALHLTARHLTALCAAAPQVIALHATALPVPALQGYWEYSIENPH
ncbi:hypothetical protein T261_4307 [Streptomyces lydicus]|nr:hypothetical protein T261_4307 [Streptomyces lydicus]